MPDNQPLLWTGPRRVRMLFYSLARHARRVAGHRASSVMQQAIASPRLRRLARALGIIHTGAAIVFAVLLFAIPVESRLSARGRFTELDRSGVINTSALRQFPASYGFGNVATLEDRHTVPDYLAASPERGQTFNAAVRLAATSANAIVWLALCWRSRVARQPGTVA